MNINDGTIIGVRMGGVHADQVIIDSGDMTETQKENQRVSLYDHRSKLGKKLTSERKKRKLRRSKIYN